MSSGDPKRIENRKCICCLEIEYAHNDNIVDPFAHLYSHSNDVVSHNYLVKSFIDFFMQF